ncbi:hypothetical protein RintRC_6278 [Richelia intracellularis]|nr:hypothetical protein RintRC_6278 [Richelia intracellularis]
MAGGEFLLEIRSIYMTIIISFFSPQNLKVIYKKEFTNESKI